MAQIQWNWLKALAEKFTPVTFTQTESATSATVAAMTAPDAAAGSGADATTYAGAECDALRADVLANKTNINALIDLLQDALLAK